MFKKIFYSIIIGIVIGGLSTGFILSRRYSGDYSELENRYTIIENANTSLRKSNNLLAENNKRITELQSRDAELIKSGQSIVDRLEEELGNSSDAIDRIEIGISALGEIIEIMFTESKE